MKIERALDWNKASDNLRIQLNSIGYNPDLNRMFQNINNMVTELSKLEVTHKRTPSHSIPTSKLDQINAAIDHLEKLILMAKLML